MCGNQLKNKWDYENPSYSPTIAMLTHMSLLQLSIHDKMHMATYDTVSAYLHQPYSDEAKPPYFKFPKNLAMACEFLTFGTKARAEIEAATHQN